MNFLAFPKTFRVCACYFCRSLSKEGETSKIKKLAPVERLNLKDAFFDFFSDASWLQSLAYLADITEQLNKFNLRLQEPDTNIFQFRDILNGFVEKIQNWNRRVKQGNLAMFEKLSGLESTGLRAQIKSVNIYKRWKMNSKSTFLILQKGFKFFLKIRFYL